MEQHNFSDDELEITVLPERDEMLGVPGILSLTGVGSAVSGVLGSLLPITIHVGPGM